MSENRPILEVQNLSKYFPWGRGFFKHKGNLRAVDDVSFHVNEGETVALVGESGCGKSTTGRLILQLENPTAGSVLFNKTPLNELTEEEFRTYRQDVQVVFQDTHGSLNPRKTLRQILTTALVTSGKMKGASKTDLLSRAGEILEDVGLTPANRYLDRYPHQLSGGQRQRVCIARALVTEPKLIVADEPVSALDVSVRAQVLKLLKKLQEEQNMAYIFISHDLAVVRSIAHWVCVMYLGKIVEYGPVETVFAERLHPYTEALFSATPIPDPRETRGRERIILKGNVPSPSNPPNGCTFHTRCFYARDICKRELPPSVQIADDYFVTCHFAEERNRGGMVGDRGTSAR